MKDINEKWLYKYKDLTQKVVGAAMVHKSNKGCKKCKKCKK